MWPLRTMSFFVLFVLMCALSLVCPLVGIVNYLMIYQINPTTSWWGKPLVTLGIRFSMLAAVCLMVGMVLNWTRMPRVRPLICTWQALLILLVVIAVISRVIGLEVTDWPTELTLEKFAKMAIFVLCLTHVVSDMKSFLVLFWTLVAGSLMLGYDAYTAPQWQFMQGRLDDVGGPDFQASSGLAAHMAAMLPLIGVAAMTAKKWRWRIFALVAGAFSVNAIILCRTRSAFIAIIVAAIAAVLLAPRARRFRVYIAIGIAAVASFSLTDRYFWERMDTLQDEEYMAQDVAVSMRKQVWAAAMVMIADQPQGVGCGNFARVIGRYDHEVRYRGSHNTFILCCAELGIHGFVVFAMLIGASFVQLYRCRALAMQSRDPPRSMLFVYGMVLSIIVYCTAGVFTERFYVESFWWVLALPTCYYRAIHRETELRIEKIENVGM
ncbi:MAG: O-antigen ligase family protein [Phycisphaerae bacterium]|nr:O-antigen ligase family protein [Phycisphaerae bacterium]